MKELSALTVKRKTGKELFHYNGKALPVDLLSFWSWSSSDLVNNNRKIDIKISNHLL